MIGCWRSGRRRSLHLRRSIEGGVSHYAEAQRCSQQVLAERPDEPVALFGLARMRIMRGEKDLSENLDALLKAERMAAELFVDLYGWPGNDLYLWLGRICSSDLPKAIECLEKVIELNGDVMMAHTLLGHALLRTLSWNVLLIHC